ARASTNAAGIAMKRKARASRWLPLVSASRAAKTSIGGSTRGIPTKVRPRIGRSFTLRAAAPDAKGETHGRRDPDLARTRLVPPRLAGRQAHLCRSVARQPQVPGDGERARSLRRDRGHARP